MINSATLLENPPSVRCCLCNLVHPRLFPSMTKQSGYMMKQIALIHLRVKVVAIIKRQVNASNRQQIVCMYAVKNS